MVNMFGAGLGRFVLAACAVAGLMCVSRAALSEEVKVTPYRPTVTNSAGLSAPGWLEMESGAALQGEQDGSRQSSLPYLFKLAFSPDFGVLLGGDALVAQRSPDGSRLSGGGDTSLMLKHRFELETAELGCEYGFKAPTAANGLGSGERDYTLNGIYSRNIGQHGLDANLNVTRLGDAQPGASPYEYGMSATVFHPLNGGWGGMAEISATARSGTLPRSQWLVAANYEWSSSLVLDLGLSSGIDKRSHRYAVFAGMSMLLGKVR